MQTSLITDGNYLVRIDRVVDTVEGEVEDGEKDPRESPGGSKWVTTDPKSEHQSKMSSSSLLLLLSLALVGE